MQSSSNHLHTLVDIDAERYYAIESAISKMLSAGIGIDQYKIGIEQRGTSFRVFLSDISAFQGTCSHVIDVNQPNYESRVVSAAGVTPCPSGDSVKTVSVKEYLAIKSAVEIARQQAKTLRIKNISLVKDGTMLIALLSAVDRHGQKGLTLGGPGIEVYLNESDLSVERWHFAR